MCTLVLGVAVLGPRTVLLAANRDEDPARPSDPPRVLSARPRVVGGRDRQAGGTWLALRGRHAAVAMLNRRPRRGWRPEATRCSRGLLALDAAAADASGDDIAGAVLARAETLAGAAAYAPFSLVVASPAGCWLIVHDGSGPPRTIAVGPGWHVLTHEDLDDPREPRAAWLMRQLAGFAPRSRAEAEARLIGLLRLHAGEAAWAPAGHRREAGAAPTAVCIHAGRMQTVSSALVWLAPDEAAYAHAEGRPCTHDFTEYTHLLDEAPRGA